MPYSGYFYAMAVGFQDVFWGFYTPFLMCIRNCDSPPGDTASFDLTNYSANGTIVATDNNCPSAFCFITQSISELENPVHMSRTGQSQANE